MRRGHFVFFICLFFLGAVSLMLVNQYRINKATSERRDLENALVQAAEVATESLTERTSFAMETMLDEVSRSFFSALSMNLFLNEKMEKRMEQEFYVPLLIITDVDGFYMCILEIVDTAEGSLIKRRWTECIPYVYEDESFFYRFFLDGRVYSLSKANEEVVYTSYGEVRKDNSLLSYYDGSQVFVDEEKYNEVKRMAVVSSIEQSASRALSNQSYIAGQVDINISYTCPSFASILREDAEQMFMAIYQGFPSVLGVGYEYGGVQTASYIKEKDVYYVTEQSYYRLAHKEGCVELSGESIGPMEYNRAVSEFGCYGCPKCIGERKGFVTPP